MKRPNRLSNRVASILAAIVFQVTVHAEWILADAPPDRPITLKLLGWDEAAVKCKFLRENYDRITLRAGTKEEELRPLVLGAIGAEIEDRASKATLTDDEKAWAEFLANDENDRLAGIDSKLDVATKRVVDDLVEAVKAGKRPECDAEPPLSLTSTEAAAVLEKLKARVPELAKRYDNERETAARVRILEELTAQAPGELLDQLKRRAEPPANLTEQQAKTDLKLDLAILRSRLRGHIATDPVIKPPATSKPPEPPKPEERSRVKDFESYAKPYVRGLLQVPSNLAGVRNEADLRALVASSIESALRQFISGDLTEAERAETAGWVDDLTAEHLHLLNDDPVVPPVVIQPPVVVQPPIVVQPIFPDDGCGNVIRRSCCGWSRWSNRHMVPVGGVYRLR